MEDDRELIAAASRGNRPALALLYERHSRSLFLHARTLSPDEAAAEDVVHGVFERLLASPGFPEGVTSVVGYLHAMARNLALNERRGDEREARRREEAGRRRPWFTEPEDRREELALLNRAMDDLPAEKREVVILKVWSEMTLEEAAMALGENVNTVASRYRSAMAALRENLKDFLPGAGEGGERPGEG